MRDRVVRLGAGRLCVRRGLAACVALLALAVYASSASAASYTAYVVNNEAATVTPVLTASNTPGIPIGVGISPVGVAITPDGSTAYVTNSLDNSVTPIATATGKPGTPISVGEGPWGIAITPDGRTAYVADLRSDTVTPITLATNTPGSPIPVGSEPLKIAITPDGKTAYVTDTDSGAVTPITTATNTAGAPIPAGPDPHGIAITPDGQTAYVTNSSSDTVTPITLSTNTPGPPIPVGSDPHGIAITPDGTTAYVANLDGNSVTPITTATDTPASPIPAGAQPQGIAITPDGRTAYVVNGAAAGTVTPITIATNAPGDPIPVGAAPQGIAISPATRRDVRTSVTCSPQKVLVGRSTRCTATVRDTDSGAAITPTGTVGFATNGLGSLAGSPCALSGSAAHASCEVTYTPLTAGSHLLTASFSGDAVHTFNGGQRTVEAFGSDPGSSYIAYVADEVSYRYRDSTSGTVTPITTGSDMPQLPIHALQPLAIAITPDGKTAYVTSVLDNLVTSVTLATSTEAFRIPVARSPVAIAIAPDGATAYVSSFQRGMVTPIAVATNTREAPIRVGSLPGAIAITPNGQTAYVVVSGGGVTPLTLATSMPGSLIPIAGGACGIAITPDGKTAYVTGPGGVTPVTIATNTPGSAIPIAGGACGIAITPNGKTAYVTGPGGVTPVTIATNTPGSAIQAGPSPGGIAITPDGKTALVVNGGADTVTPITLATNTTGNAIAAGKNPSGIAIAPNPLRQTSMSVSCSPTKAVVGVGPTCTATVSDIDTGRPLPPIGRVTFTSWLGRKVSFGSSCMLSGRGASASCQVTFAARAPAVYELLASYTSDGVHTLDHALTTVRLEKRSTSTTLACAPTPLVVGRPTRCTATVSDISPGSIVTPGGKVTFGGQPDDHFIVNPCRLSGSGATASCGVIETPTAIGTGSHTITATYAPAPWKVDHVHKPSAGSITVPVIDPSTTSLTCSPTTVRIGQTTVCTASVTDPAPAQASTPTGTVTFSAAKSYTFAGSPCTLSADSAPAADCRVNYTPTVGQGPHTITARYGGDGSHHTSNAKVTITVTR